MSRRVLQVEDLYRGKLRAQRDTLELESGVIIKHETVVHPGAVVLLPVTDSGELMLIKQYRHSVSSTLIEAPAGTLESGEEIEKCAYRELTEEIGMGARELLFMGSFYPAPGFCDEKQQFFFARGLFVEQGTPDIDEEIEVLKMKLEDFDRMVLSGEITDTKTIAIVTVARLKKLIPHFI